jgi:calcium-dependent protein kinase
MGNCVSGKSSVSGSDTKRILSMVRHVRPESQALGNARMISHIDLWDEYSFGTEKQVLGEGLNGPVVKIFSRRDPSLCYALKEIRTTTSSTTGPSSSALVGLVLNELEVILQLDHYHVARVFEVYESATSIFLVTELCSGGELYGRLHQVKRFNEIEAIFLISQILKAINYIHSLDIVHGDLKLENFLFSTKDSVLRSPIKLIDFGFSHLGSNASSLLCGSPQYMAPEKLLSRSETTKSDMWSIGVIAFMLLTGKSPFKTVKNMDQMRNYFTSESSPNITIQLRKSLETYFSISSDGADFIWKLLDINPDNRMSARAALSHKWLAGMEFRRTHSRLTVVDDLKICAELLKEFSSIGPLRRAAIGLISMYGPPLLTLKTAPALFDAIDTNNDGFIQLNELEVLFNNPNTAQDIFNAVDLVGDGRINFTEFIASTDVYLTIKQQERGDLPVAYEAIIESIFRKLDIDNSGFISENNLLCLFGNRGYKGAKSRDLIREGDFVGDGVISLDEFFTLISRGKDYL